MARQYMTPFGFVTDEDGDEEYMTPFGVVLNEDQAADTGKAPSLALTGVGLSLAPLVILGIGHG